MSGLATILRRFDAPDEVRVFPKGRFELVQIGGMTIGRATYEPGWRWSQDVGAALGEASCAVEHVGLVISGCAAVGMDDGAVHEMRAGDLFYVPPGHDSWVVGENPMSRSTSSARTIMRRETRLVIPAKAGISTKEIA